ncbi:hypothetical protein SVAN01_11199 [Stagonosporopsis vannaccii]|nr:hypothetical protein SVAN01_11199 [Stagonosporopsis vannaccii]
MLLKLPVELRLRIAEFALEQHATAGIPFDQHLPESDYRPSDNLALLLVCRQFNTDFAQLAYNKTRFLLRGRMQGIRLQELPLCRLKEIRMLVYILIPHDIQSWGSYFYNLEQLRLDELVILCPHGWANGHSSIRNTVLFLRRLEHVKTVKFILYAGGEGLKRAPCFSLIGTIMKEDHFQRYDAHGAPNVELTSWDWHLNGRENSVTLHAKNPEPVTTEEEYMRLMKPKVDALMAIAQQEAGL